MKRLLIASVLMVFARAGYCEGIYFQNNVGNPRNARILLVTPTALAVTKINNLDNTFVVMNDDTENTIYYGDSTCSTSSQKILPTEKVTFQGAVTGFTIYVCTASGSAELRVVENP